MFIDGYIIVLDLQEVKAHTAQLQKISVNINQITRRINKTGRIYTDNMDELTSAVLNDIVKAVYVLDKSSDHREQQIDISYDLVEYFPRPC